MIDIVFPAIKEKIDLVTKAHKEASYKKHHIFDFYYYYK